jgi:hypothetical protein
LLYASDMLPKLPSEAARTCVDAAIAGRIAVIQPSRTKRGSAYRLLTTVGVAARAASGSAVTVVVLLAPDGTTLTALEARKSTFFTATFIVVGNESWADSLPAWIESDRRWWCRHEPKSFLKLVARVVEVRTAPWAPGEGASPPRTSPPRHARSPKAKTPRPDAAPALGPPVRCRLCALILTTSVDKRVQVAQRIAHAKLCPGAAPTPPRTIERDSVDLLDCPWMVMPGSAFGAKRRS